jgi:hypothetical protein
MRSSPPGQSVWGGLGSWSMGRGPPGTPHPSRSAAKLRRREPPRRSLATSSTSSPTSAPARRRPGARCWRGRPARRRWRPSESPRPRQQRHWRRPVRVHLLHQGAGERHPARRVRLRRETAPGRLARSGRRPHIVPIGLPRHHAVTWRWAGPPLAPFVPQALGVAHGRTQNWPAGGGWAPLLPLAESLGGR